MPPANVRDVTSSSATPWCPSRTLSWPVRPVITDYDLPMRRVRNPVALGKGLVVLAVQVGAAWLAYLWVVFESLSITGCGQRCDTGVIAAALAAQMWVGVGSLVVAALGILVLAVRGRESWSVPAIGIAVIVATCVVASLVVDAATTR